MQSILICISFNIMIKLILIIRHLWPSIGGNTLFIFSKIAMILLWLVVTIRNISWDILTELLFYNCYYGSYETLSLVHSHLLAQNWRTQSHSLYSLKTASPNIFLQRLIVPLFTYNRRDTLLHLLHLELFYCNT